VMNAFYEHHQNSIRFQYACFDRILLNAAIPLLRSPLPRKGSLATTVTSTQLPERWLHDISERYHHWVRAQPDRMVAIIKSREPANILVSIGGRDSQGCHLDRMIESSGRCSSACVRIFRSPREFV